MSHSKVRQVFETSLAAFALSKGYGVVFDNTTFEHTADDISLISTLIAADTFSDSLSGDHKAYTGIFQITICASLGLGAGYAEDVLEEIQSLYPLYARFGDSVFKVVVMTPVHRLTARAENSMFYLPVRFEYRADTN